MCVFWSHQKRMHTPRILLGPQISATSSSHLVGSPPWRTKGAHHSWTASGWWHPNQMDSEEQDSIDPSANAHDRWSSKFGNHRTIVMWVCLTEPKPIIFSTSNLEQHRNSNSRSVSHSQSLWLFLPHHQLGTTKHCTKMQDQSFQ